jgi:hypothetical protein
MHRFVVFETILAALPAIITLAGLIIWWRTLSHRTLFVVTGYLSLFTIESAIRRLLMPIYFYSGPPMSSEDVSNTIDFLDSSRTKASVLAAVLLLALGGGLLLWLRIALRRP